MDIEQLLLIAFRATLVYFILLFTVRILGKREIGNFSAFDLIVALILGEAVDEAIYGDVTVLKFVILVATVAIWDLVTSWLSYKSDAIRKLLESPPLVLVDKGKMNQENMARERIPEEDLYSMLRLQSIDDIQEVKKGTLEPNGRLSVIKEEWAKTIQKGDIPDKK